MVIHFYYKIDPDNYLKLFTMPTPPRNYYNQQNDTISQRHDAKQNLKDQIFMSNTQKSLKYKLAESKVMDCNKSLIYKQREAQELAVKLSKTQNEIHGAENARERALLELILLGDGINAVQINLSLLTNSE